MNRNTGKPTGTPACVPQSAPCSCCDDGPTSYTITSESPDAYHAIIAGTESDDRIEVRIDKPKLPHR